MGLLGEFITVLNLCFNQTGDGDVIMDILKRLAMCSRFKLALGFLSKDEKRAVRIVTSFEVSKLFAFLFFTVSAIV